MKTYYLFKGESNISYEIDLTKWTILSLEFSKGFFAIRVLCFEVTFWLNNLKITQITEDDIDYVCITKDN